MYKCEECVIDLSFENIVLTINDKTDVRESFKQFLLSQTSLTISFPKKSLRIVFDTNNMDFIMNIIGTENNEIDKKEYVDKIN